MRVGEGQMEKAAKGAKMRRGSHTLLDVRKALSLPEGITRVDVKTANRDWMRKRFGRRER